jgi:peptide alpha-N-acetyltransferase
MLEKSGLLLESLAIIDECLLHTPTALDMHIRKARILRKLGDPISASQTVDYCRALDLQDRYLNNKTTKYLLRADNVELGMDRIAMFTKVNIHFCPHSLSLSQSVFLFFHSLFQHDGDPQQTLLNLQCNWYELELADSYSRLKQFGLALKAYYAVQKNFIQYFEDQFDFHGF